MQEIQPRLFGRLDARFPVAEPSFHRFKKKKKKKIFPSMVNKPQNIFNCFSNLNINAQGRKIE